ncbi:GntP family permease [Tautonia plasticadhaerens]|uniref:Gnt-II system L-idonate transporter n=1 Tax=Tautonia plasticadhaerens TaxID=2527974 RepID=A0A518HDN3_9BACT|nr:GntP family permease [Tautonia plasticadhaerens]QDV38961.1 Gnt-II system L-idonate transporter [Tautonia plasticadhaerens]
MHPVSTLLLAVGIVLLGILWLRLHAFLALLLAAFTVAALTPQSTLRAQAEAKLGAGDWTAEQAESFASSSPADRVAEGFGSTATGIGILIAMAAIVGKCLLDSGAADRIVRSAVLLVGQGRAALAFLASGFVLAIPVFFDTVFYLIMPLGKAMWMRTGKDYLLYVLSIVAGATMAHSLVPPTPGPLLVAGELGVDLLTMGLAGIVVGSAASLTGYAFARWLNRRMDIPLRESADLSIKDLESVIRRPDSELPPLWLSLAPIVLPFLLIAADAALTTHLDRLGEGAPVPSWASTLSPAFRTLGDKNVALSLAAAVALATLAARPGMGRSSLAEAVRSALAGGGVIILITSAGGAFGAAIRQGGVAETIERLAGGGSAMAVLPLAFLVSALVRTAQGSATVAMITAVGVLAPLAESGALGCHPVYLAMAIGCGSKPVAWMADSGFWVICQMSGLTEAEGLKTVTPMTAIMGVAGLAVTMLGAWLLPMA